MSLETKELILLGCAVVGACFWIVILASAIVQRRRVPKCPRTTVNAVLGKLFVSGGNLTEPDFSDEDFPALREAEKLGLVRMVYYYQGSDPEFYLTDSGAERVRVIGVT